MYTKPNLGNGNIEVVPDERDVTHTETLGHRAMGTQPIVKEQKHGAELIKVHRYEPTEATNRWIAIFDGGHRVTVDRSRARAYPGLPSPAPCTTGLYRIATHAIGRKRAVVDVGCG